MMGEVFEGGPGRAPLPSAVRRGACFNSLGLQPYQGFIAAAQFNAHLDAGQSRTWTVAFGAAPNDAAERRAFLGRVRTEVLADGGRVLADLADAWRQKVTADAIQTPDVQLDRYYNVWSKFQLRNQSRFIACLDKIGYRDVLQNLMTLADFDPGYVRAAMVETVKYQFPDGRAVRQYEKFPNTGHDLRMYHDSPVWMPDTLVRYVKETGDKALLDEVVPFLDSETLRPSQTEAGTMYEHAARAVRSVYGHTGYHGLCRIGYGDWNDAISGIGGEKGVSVWLSCACVYAARIMAELAGHLGKAADEEEFQGIVRALTERINEHAWDGAWYIYAISGKGEPIGSARSAEGQIHLNVNTWALFSGVAAAAGREAAVWKAIGQLATPLGHLLIRPSYTQASRPTVGRIADQMPGMFENGSVYTHGESFYLYALVSAGRADQWHREIYQTLPSHLVPDISTAPPHQQSNFSVGPDHVACGTNLFSNFTGSVGWYRKTIERIVGVLPDFEALRIAPMPPKAWDAYQVKRTFRGCEMAIDFRRADRRTVLLDGKEVGDLIPAALLAGRKRATIKATYV
jgi:cellobiose phosphorylase